jgi:sensor histidine kinase YesM
MKIISSSLFFLLVSIVSWSQTLTPPTNIITNDKLIEGSLQFIDVISHGQCNQSILSGNGFNNHSKYVGSILNSTNETQFVLELENYLVDSIKVYTNDIKETELLVFSENSKPSKPLFNFSLPRDSTLSLVIEVWNRPPFSIPVKLWSVDNQFAAQSSKALFLGIGFGVFILIFIFSIVAFILFKERTYLYYGLYVLFTYLFYFTEYGYLNNFGFQSLAFSEQFIFSIVTLSAISFLLFCYKLFKVKVKAINLAYKALGYMSVAILLMINSPLINSFLFFKFIYIAFISIFLMTFIIGMFRVAASEFKPKQTKYIIAISYVLLIIAIIVKPISFLGVIEYGFVAKYGSIIAQNIELLVLAGLLFSIQFKASKYTSELERKKLHYQNAALQAQMNPHFIFNSLNSIQSFIMSNEKVQAMDYLTKFAKLIRQTLKSSAESQISISEEVESLCNYLELEKLRMDNRFDYSIKCINTDSIMDVLIPPMLIQPFVENAVIHGMKSKQNEGTIQITLEYKPPFIEATIFDNGQYIDPSNQSKHKSLGTKITNARLSIVNNADFHVIPEVSKEGTTVRLEIRTL